MIGIDDYGFRKRLITTKKKKQKQNGRDDDFGDFVFRESHPIRAKFKQETQLTTVGYNARTKLVSEFQVFG